MKHLIYHSNFYEGPKQHHPQQELNNPIRDCPMIEYDQTQPSERRALINESIDEYQSQMLINIPKEIIRYDRINRAEKFEEYKNIHKLESLSKKISKGEFCGLKKSQRKTRRPWNLQEDQLITSLIEEHGLNWNLIAIKINVQRTGKQIRERYLNILDPAIDASRWKEEEDELLLNLFKTYGRQWCKLSKLMKGRTETMVKNRFMKKFGNYLKQDSTKNRSTYILTNSKESTSEENSSSSNQNEQQKKSFGYFDSSEQKFIADFSINQNVTSQFSTNNINKSSLLMDEELARNDGCKESNFNLEKDHCNSNFNMEYFKSPQMIVTNNQLANASSEVDFIGYSKFSNKNELFMTFEELERTFLREQKWYSESFVATDPLKFDHLNKSPFYPVNESTLCTLEDHSRPSSSVASKEERIQILRSRIVLSQKIIEASEKELQ